MHVLAAGWRQRLPPAGRVPKQGIGHPVLVGFHWLLLPLLYLCSGGRLAARATQMAVVQVLPELVRVDRRKHIPCSVAQVRLAAIAG